MPEATQERQISGLKLIRELQALPAEVLEMPVNVYVPAQQSAGDAVNDGRGDWVPVVGVTSTADRVEIVLEDDE